MTVPTTDESPHPTARSWLVRAANPSPMTLEGTNTWVLAEPGARRAVVVDPGPDDTDHRAAIVEAVAAAGTTEVGLILLTHSHLDHTAGALTLAAIMGAPVAAAAPELCVESDPLADMASLDIDGLRLDVLAAPGHTADSMCFVVGADGALLTGDTVLGRGPTVVARPDGRLADYLATLRRLRAVAQERRLTVVLPGHGPVAEDPVGLVDSYLEHRAQRLDQVRSAAAQAASVDDVLHEVYGDVDPELLFAARWSLLAQLDYLRDRGITVPPDAAT
jgi:glyoxylase-like metal-dependent hydrolase (beta-lactamase superfamily II)